MQFNDAMLIRINPNDTAIPDPSQNVAIALGGLAVRLTKCFVNKAVFKTLQTRLCNELMKK